MRFGIVSFTIAALVPILAQAAPDYPICSKIINHIGRLSPGSMCCVSRAGAEPECVERKLEGDSLFPEKIYNGMSPSAWVELMRKNDSVYWSTKDEMIRAARAKELREDSIEAAQALQDSLSRVAKINSTKWLKKTKKAVIDHKVFIGMSAEQALESWGEPESNNRTITAAGTSEQWVYGSDFLYFTNGILTAIQD